jgi:hypothetical protein
LIVPFGPAGATDITARLIGQWLSERLGQQFVIENRPGAGSNVGTEAVVRAAPDGYTLGLFGAPSAINATLYDKLNFNFVRDIAPIAPIVRFPYIMVVNPLSDSLVRSSGRGFRHTQPSQTSRRQAAQQRSRPVARMCGGRVDEEVAHPHPSQIRMCRFPASGSSWGSPPNR